MLLNDYPTWLWKKAKMTTRKKKDQQPTQYIAKVILPYLPGVHQKVSRVLTAYKIRCCFLPNKKISQLLPSPKDPVDLDRKQGVVYEIPCSSCNLTYIGETKRSFHTRLAEHKADVRKNRHQNTALANHAYENNHEMNWDKFKILALESNWHKRKFIESFYINSNRHSINAKNSVQFPAIYENLLWIITRKL